MQPVGRVPPHDLEVEKAVLSALLLDNDAIHSILIEIRAEDFYHPAHQQLFRAMLVLCEENEPVDLHTLSDYLQTRKLLDAIGGPVFLAEIADYEATAANVLQHAKIVRDKSVKRSLIAVATEIAEAGFEQTDRAEATAPARGGGAVAEHYPFTRSPRGSTVLRSSSPRTLLYAHALSRLDRAPGSRHRACLTS